VIGQTVSHYKILEPLGGGGMGVVYRAQDIKLDRHVALKFLPPDLTRDPEAKQRFVREAKAASALQHNNICVVHDIDETPDGQMFISMECLEGETLEKKIERAPLEIEEALEIAIQVAQGLTKAHEHGIIHRDVKPANIMITTDGVAKIVDFGLAKLTGRTLLTRSGGTLGTAAYMSPEQARGEAVDERTDIWSLGVVLYEMLTGQRPFKAEYDNALIYCILNTDPLPLAGLRTGVPAALDQTVAKCLAKIPEGRYKRADELLVDLRSAVNETSRTGTPRKHSLRLTPRGKSKRHLRYTLAALGTLILALIGYVTFVPRVEKGGPFPHLKMIAVLPFENLGPAEDEYFADGLTEEITSRLGTISGLGVISRQSAMQYKKSTKTLPVVAEELGVDYILVATIRWARTDSTQRIRITPHLLQVSGDVQLWAENMDRTLDDIFRVQTEIAAQVVHALGIVLREGDRGLVEAIPTNNLEAYQAYLRGLSSGPGYEKNNTRTAIEMFERAVALDSTFALAYVKLSNAHLMYYWEGSDRSTEQLAAAKQALDRAYALQPDLPEASVALSLYYYWGYRDYQRALETLQEVEERLPNDIRVLSTLASIRRRQGKFEEAVEGFKNAFKLDPKSFAEARGIGNTLYQLGNYPEAENYLDRSISLLPDQSLTYIMKSNMYLRWHGDAGKSRKILELVPTVYFPWERLVELDVYERNYRAALDRLAKAPEQLFVAQHEITPVSQLRGLIYRFMGDTVRSRASFDSARAVLESEITKRPDDHRLHISLGITFAGLGRKAEAVREAERAAELMPISSDAVTGAFPLIGLAQVCTMVGMHDAALDRLAYLLSLHAPKFITPPLLRIDPIYDPLRSNPRFHALLAKYDRISAR
jgi:serine/threonine protein kinase/tetratricopeptide (TPR) repeat protein